MKKFFSVVVFIVPLHFAAAQNVLPGYHGFWDRNKMISVLDILEYYPDRLPYLRNEVYARYGRPFVTPEYQDYFNRQSWYTIRSNYTDAWLSGADTYNAELLRAIEQAPSAAETANILLRNVEYRSNEHFLVFNGREVMESTPGGYGMYSGWGGISTSVPYIIVGDWVLVAGSAMWNYDTVYAYRLDHKTKKITATARGTIDRNIFDRLQARNGRLNLSR